MPKHPVQITMPVLGEGATAFYQAELERLRQPTDLSLQLLDTDFERINANLPDNYQVLTPLLDSLLEKLEATGAALYLIPNITLHAAIDRMALDEAVLDRIINPIDCGIARLKAGNIDHITLAGTRHTMQSDQLAGFFTAREIDVQFPAEHDIDNLDRLRLHVFEQGFSHVEREAMDKLLSRYDNVVLACTELSMLNPDEKFIDLARLQIAAALARL